MSHPSRLWRPSPNFDERPAGVGPSLIILHYTEFATTDLALKHLTSSDSRVSSHYLIGDSGVIYQLVGDEHRAWHAGVSSWGGQENLNNLSLGIELQNEGLNHTPYPAVQMDALLELLGALTEQYGIPGERILGHSDIAPSRKIDPGPHFDWALLARHGYGLGHTVPWPLGKDSPTIKEWTLQEIQERLRSLGYACPTHGLWDAETQAVVAAFQSHFLQSQDSSLTEPMKRALKGLSVGGVKEFASNRCASLAEPPLLLRGGSKVRSTVAP